MKILIVDDNPLQVQAVSMFLVNDGHEVHYVMEGLEAIKEMQDRHYDLVLCDVMMPGISGLSLVSILRNIYLFRCPIIMISSSENYLIRTQSIDAGAEVFLKKPVSTADLRRHINRIINKSA
ncbi:N/A [soil metagenome]